MWLARKMQARRLACLVATAVGVVIVFSLANLSPGGPDLGLRGILQRSPAVLAREEDPLEAPANRTISNDSGLPSEYFPIEIHNIDSPDPSFEFCRLNFPAYHASPSTYPMFRDLQTASCSRDTITVPFSKLTVSPHAVPPSGFVFHASRTGSTTVANILASDENNLVFSESGPIPQIILHCRSCDDRRRLDLLRVAISAYGNSIAHTRLFFKFQSALTPHIHTIVSAFPKTPWIFLFRNPTEILVSLLAGGSRLAPCLRTRASPPPAIRAMLGDAAGTASREQYCAAHLKFLFATALESAISERGTLVHYESLLPSLFEAVLPILFRHALPPPVKNKMMQVAGVYSKGRQQSPVAFADDSKTKRDKASEEMQQWAKTYLSALYQRMLTLSTTQHAALKNRNAPRAPRKSKGNAASKGGYYPPSDVIEVEPEEHLPYPPLLPFPTLIEQWPIDDPAIPPIDNIHAGSLERLDFTDERDRERANTLRTHEIPFMLLNVPEIEAVVDKWSHDYLIGSFGQTMQQVHRSVDNQFPYYNRQLAARDKSYVPHTTLVSMTYAQWLDAARAVEDKDVHSEHFYFQTADFGVNKWIASDLGLFAPRESFFVPIPKENRGINCRFGSKGIVAQAHYDGGRNFIAMLKGAKRYILFPPEECGKLYLYPRPHPESRHSMKDWSHINWTDSPLLKTAKAAQVIVREGEILYVPSYWFHHIISLGISAQCNTRSGDAIRGRDHLKKCGFY